MSENDVILKRDTMQQRKKQFKF